MSTINNSEYICDFSGCKKYFKEPINLPCGHIVCKQHLNKLETTFKCLKCDTEAVIPKGGFKIDLKMNETLKSNSHLTGQHKQVKEKFDQLEKTVNNFYEKHLDRPQLFIHEFFAEIRNKIDIQREIFIARHLEQNHENIHKRSEEFLSRLKQLEQECYQNEEKISKLNLKEDKEDEMKAFSESLRFENLEEIELIDMKDKINNLIEAIKMKSKRFENSLLMNKTISFVEEYSVKLGHLIVNQRFDQFEITKESCKLIKTLQGHTNWVRCIEQIDDYSKIVTGSHDNSIKIWSTESGECLKTLKDHTDWVLSLIISNDKKYLISGSRDKTIKIWNIENDFECVQTLQQVTGVTAVMSLCLLPNNILVCGSG
jgi:hypothetical protein